MIDLNYMKKVLYSCETEAHFEITKKWGFKLIRKFNCNSDIWWVWDSMTNTYLIYLQKKRRSYEIY